MWAGLTSVPVLRTIVPQAYVALGTFFAISGFLLAYGYSHRNWNQANLIRYSTARVARIYPLYAFSLLVVAPIIVEQIQNPRLGSVLHRAWILMDYGLLLQGWKKLPVDWNTPAWSLSCEMFFYAGFPLVAWWLSGKAARIPVLLMLAFGLPAAAHIVGVPTQWKPFTYVGDFLAGMAAAAIYERIQSRNGWLACRGYWVYLPALLTGFVTVVFSKAVHSWIVFDATMRLVNGACILGMALRGGRLCNWLSSPVALLGGTASYAIYILHVPILWWYRRSSTPDALPPFLSGLLYVTLVLLLAVAASRWIEYPGSALLRERLDHWLLRGRTPVPTEGEEGGVRVQTNPAWRGAVTSGETGPALEPAGEGR